MPPFTKTAGAVALLSCILYASAARAQTERRSISGDRVAIYNLAGKLRVESGSGSDVVVEITRGGRAAGPLRVEAGSIRGEQTLGVIFPKGHVLDPGRRRGGQTAG